MDSGFQTVVAGGVLYAAAYAVRGDVRGDVPADLLVARGKPGAAAKAVKLEGAHNAGSQMMLLSSARGAVYLLAASQVGGTAEGRYDLELWDIARPQPARVKKVHEGGSIWGATAALQDEGTLHVAYSSADQWFGMTVSIK